MNFLTKNRRPRLRSFGILFLAQNISKALLIFLGIGFLLRTINLTYAFPILYMSGDEANYHLSALHMLSERTLFTIGNYGPLGAYIQIPFLAISAFVLFLGNKIHSFSELQILVASNEGYFLFVPRVVSALFGTLSIVAVYRLAKLLFVKREIALFSSLLSTLSLNLVFISHQARPWSPAIFFALTAIYFALLVTKRSNAFIKYATFSMICCAISFGFHQIGGLIVILCILIMKNVNFPLRIFIRKMIIPSLVFLFLVIFFNYLSLGPKFFSILNPFNRSDAIELIQPGSSTQFRPFLIYNFFRKLLLSDFVIILLFLPFFVLTEFKTKLYASFKIFILLNLFLSLFIFPTFIRYFLLSFSLFPLFAGAILYKIVVTLKYPYLAFFLIVLAVAFNSLYFNFLLLQKNTYSDMREWVANNVLPQTPIIATTYRGIGFVPVKSATLKVKEEKPGYYQKANELIGDTYLPNTRFIVYAEEFGKAGMTEADYVKVALSFYDASIIIDPYLKSSERLFVNNGGLQLKLLAHFSPTGNMIYDKFIPEVYSDSSFLFPLFKIQRPGPYFDILKVVK